MFPNILYKKMFVPFVFLIFLHYFIGYRRAPRLYFVNAPPRKQGAADRARRSRMGAVRAGRAADITCCYLFDKVG